MFGGYDVDWGVEIELINMYVDIMEGDMGGRNVPNKLNRVVTV